MTLLFHNKSSLEISPSIPSKVMNGPVKIDTLVVSVLITNHPPYQHVMAIFIEVFLLTAIDNYMMIHSTEVHSADLFYHISTPACGSGYAAFIPLWKSKRVGRSLWIFGINIKITEQSRFSGKIISSSSILKRNKSFRICRLLTT